VAGPQDHPPPGVGDWWRGIEMPHESESGLEVVAEDTAPRGTGMAIGAACASAKRRRGSGVQTGAVPGVAHGGGHPIFDP